MLFLSIIFGLVFVGAVISAIVARKSNDTGDRHNDRSRATLRLSSKITAGVTLALAVLSLVAASVVKVDAGEVAVEVLFGKVAAVHTAGLNLKNPLSDIVKYPIRTVESTYTSQEDEGEKAGNDAIQAFSKENAAVFVDLTVLWHIDPLQADVVYKTVKDQYREVLVRPITRSATRDCVAEYEFDVARTTARGDVSACIVLTMENQLAERGIVIESIQLRGMEADATLQQSIEDKLKAANLVKEAEFKRDQAIVDKERAIIDAEARAEAKIAEAAGEAERIIVVARAEADANNLVSKSLTEQLLQLRIYEALSRTDSSVIFMGDGDGNVTPLIPIP